VQGLIWPPSINSQYSPMPEPMSDRVRALCVQYSGDYREAYQRLSSGGPENYYAQRHSIEQAGQLANEFAGYGVLCLYADERYDEQLPNGVRAASLGQPDRDRLAAEVLEFIARFEPTHLVMTTPMADVIGPAIGSGLDVLPILADTFFPPDGQPSVKRWLRRRKHELWCRRFGRLLSDRRVRWAGNHNINASRELVRLGADPARVVPWDWPAIVDPANYSAKKLNLARDHWELVFVGSLIASKGVEDAVQAAALLTNRGRNVQLTVIGDGEVEPLQVLAGGAKVAFRGRLPHSQVIAVTRSADVALVPSRHNYPEGVPMTIYEALAVRTPVICSDHPAFRGRVGAGAVMVPERNPTAIADGVERLLCSPAGYAALSEATEAGWQTLRSCPVGFYDLIRRWAARTREHDAWLAAHSLASGRYDRLMVPSG
jgi:glycosyltransferase involved in cell wall biosynthesis